MSLFDEVITAPSHGAPKGIIYGEAGVGKTTFAASASDHIILDCENGANHLQCNKTPYLEDWRAVSRWVAGLRDDEHPYKVVVIDTADWMIRKLTDHVIDSDGNAETRTLNRCHGGYGEGRGIRESTIFRKVLPALDKITQRGVSVVLLAHTSRRKSIDADGIEVERCAPDLPQECLAALVEWSDFVCMARQSEGKRWLQTTGDARVMAKSRYHIPAAVNLKWSDFMTAIENSKTKEPTNG